MAQRTVARRPGSATSSPWPSAHRNPPARSWIAGRGSSPSDPPRHRIRAGRRCCGNTGSSARRSERAITGGLGSPSRGSVAALVLRVAGEVRWSVNHRSAQVTGQGKQAGLGPRQFLPQFGFQRRHDELVGRQPAPLGRGANPAAKTRRQTNVRRLHGRRLSRRVDASKWVKGQLGPTRVFLRGSAVGPVGRRESGGVRGRSGRESAGARRRGSGVVLVWSVNPSPNVVGVSG